MHTRPQAPLDDLQQLFFQQVKFSLPANKSLAEEVANLLNISINSAYRRIRNEKPISFEEMKILAGHYKISIDLLLKVEAGSASFSARYISASQFDFSKYLEATHNELERLAGFRNSEIIYYCKDFPQFYYYAFPELAAFKYFI